MSFPSGRHRIVETPRRGVWPHGEPIFLILLLAACTANPASQIAATPVQSLTLTPRASSQVLAVQSPTQKTLVGTHWKLLSMKGRPPLAGTTITLAFTPYFLLGSAGCNDYGNGPDSGPYRATLDGTLTITQTAITVVGCVNPPGILEQEDAYMSALQKSATYRVVNGELEIFNASGELLLVFARDG